MKRRLWHDIPNVCTKSSAMKKLLIFTAAITIAFSGIAQNKHKGKDHEKDKSDNHDKNRSGNHDNDDQKKRKTGTIYSGSGSKFSKNTPAKVRAAFNRDFPNA